MNIDDLNRRELQWLAKELDLCRANSKSEIIIGALTEYIEINGSDALSLIIQAMPEELKLNTPRTAVKNTPRTTGRVTRSARKAPNADEIKDPLIRVLNNQFSSSPEAKDVKCLPKIEETTCDLPSIQPENEPEYHTTTGGDQDQLDEKMEGTTAATSKDNTTDIQELIGKFDGLEFTAQERVRCSLTGHEMKPCETEIASYVSGKKYRAALQGKESFAEFEPMFVQHPAKPDHVICQVTGAEVLRTKKNISMHMAGNRYRSLVDVWCTLNMPKEQN